MHSPGDYTCNFVVRGGSDGGARDHYANEISNQKWPLKKKPSIPVISHIKATAKYFS